jgi:glucosamine--fructose-6-phosphate aminotransferase (isomerizing)
LEEIDEAARFLKGKRFHLLGMGSSYFATLYAQYLLTDLTQTTVMSHLASEFLHYPAKLAANEVVLAVSQSGESIETVETARLLKKSGNSVIAVTNNPESTLARFSDRVLLMHAGIEEASSTKTFAATLAILYSLIVTIAAVSQKISKRREQLLSKRIIQMSQHLDGRLAHWNVRSRSQAAWIGDSQAVMVLARGPSLAAALQGALLFKEVAKMPAEAMSSGEFSHGPIEAVTNRTSVILLAGGRTSTLQYKLARRLRDTQAKTLVISPRRESNANSISFGPIEENLAAFPAALILELLAYHTAVHKHRNPDRFDFIHKVTTRE